MGIKFGYRDGWQPDGAYSYTGEGQIGDQAFVRVSISAQS